MVVQHYKPTTSVNIKLSDAAKKRLVKVIENDENIKAMRLSVKKSGCSGYAYDLQCVTEISPEDLIIDLGDGYQLRVDAKSYAFLDGLEIDYVKDGLQHRFVYINPNQTGQCGCGESFSVR
jgi:iron-sulfur cluster assembly protein